MKLNCRVEFHASDKFLKLLNLYGVSVENILESLDLMQNKDQLFKAGRGAGASGQFFFFSRDNKFIIKTVTSNEKNLLLRMLDPMIDYIRKVNNQTLMARVFGLYTIYSREFVPIHLILMENIIRFDNKRNDRVTFDIKGSSFKRYIKVPESIRLQNDLNCKLILKDLNFLELGKNRGRSLMHLDSETCESLLAILKADTDFLASFDIMDYSFLVSIESEEYTNFSVNHQLQ